MGADVLRIAADKTYKETSQARVFYYLSTRRNKMKVDVKLEATLFDEVYEVYGDDEQSFGASVEGEVVKQAAAQLTKLVTEKAKEEMREQVVVAVNEKIGGMFDGIIDQPIKKTNRWGESKGDTQTMRELIFEEANKWLLEKVDSESGSDTRYHNDKACTRAQFYARKAVQDEFKELMETELKQVREIAKAEVSELKTILQAYLKK